jgi:hypothetical protein
MKPRFFVSTGDVRLPDRREFFLINGGSELHWVVLQQGEYVTGDRVIMRPLTEAETKELEPTR